MDHKQPTQSQVQRVFHDGKILGRIMFTGRQWLAMKRDLNGFDSFFCHVKAFPTQEEALAWVER